LNAYFSYKISMTDTLLAILNEMLTARLDAKSADFVHAAQVEIHVGVAQVRFSALIALASRYTPRQPLAPSPTELARAEAAIPGWNPSSWSLLECMRISLILSRTDLLAESFASELELWFRYADEGEQCAYYRALPLLPEPQRFVWRAAEGCRTNMRSVFMATACDSPFPFNCFDTLVWNQMVVKALFTETPLVRIYGLDKRLTVELALMVLDYMDERTSAGRGIPLDAWLCLGRYDDPRVDQFIQRALNATEITTRVAGIFALARAGKWEQLQALAAQNTNASLANVFQQTLAGCTDQAAFQAFMDAV
jgi:hypothetical protein